MSLLPESIENQEKGIVNSQELTHIIGRKVLLYVNILLMILLHKSIEHQGKVIDNVQGLIQALLAGKDY